MKALLESIKACTLCAAQLPNAPRPVMAASTESKIVLVGQAPGSKVHASGIPWDDPSGVTLRKWLGVDSATFYEPRHFAILPMGFCYPGKGKSGDMPPRPECAPQWHGQVMEQLQTVRLTLLIGQYAQRYYLQERAKATLTETVRNYQAYLPDYLPLPHPSPRNRFWLARNSWFEAEVLPLLQARVQEAMSN